MSTTVGTELIKPHGGQLIERSGPRPEGVEDLETIVLTSRELFAVTRSPTSALRAVTTPANGATTRE